MVIVFITAKLSFCDPDWYVYWEFQVKCVFHIGILHFKKRLVLEMLFGSKQEGGKQDILPSSLLALWMSPECDKKLQQKSPRVVYETWGLGVEESRMCKGLELPHLLYCPLCISSQLSLKVPREYLLEIESGVARWVWKKSEVGWHDLLWNDSREEGDIVASSLLQSWAWNRWIGFGG